mmetsp:Transcript_18804/g.29889  ORF Transcript_18804/g.29889 Transcript_18804/m.29889 type:complete len:121 (-) Transcript_18804:549-911(-)
MEYFSGFFTGILKLFGFYSKEATVVLIGLDNAGKTTLQYKLRTGESYSFVPTQKPQEQEITIGNVKLQTWDLGGHKAVRKLWKQYYRTVAGSQCVYTSVSPHNPDTLLSYSFIGAGFSLK